MVHSLERFDPQSFNGSASDLPAWIYKELRRQKLSKAQSEGTHASWEQRAFRSWRASREIATSFFTKPLSPANAHAFAGDKGYGHRRFDSTEHSAAPRIPHMHNE